VLTIKYNGVERKARTPSGAIKAASQMLKLYGRSNRNPVIDTTSEAEAHDLAETQSVAQTYFPVQVNGVAAW